MIGGVYHGNNNLFPYCAAVPVLPLATAEVMYAILGDRWSISKSYVIGFTRLDFHLALSVAGAASFILAHG